MALVTEVLVLLVLAVGVIVSGGGPDGFEASPFNPLDLFDNSAAIAVFGAGAAATTVTVAVAAYCAAFTISDSSTIAALLKLATWSPLLGVLGILFVQGVCSVAVIRYFLTEARDGFHPWKTLVAPILGALAMAGACYLLISNRAALSGAGDALYVKAIPWVAIAMFAIGIVAALYLRSKDSDRYHAIGRFEHDALGGQDAVVSPELAPART